MKARDEDRLGDYSFKRSSRGRQVLFAVVAVAVLLGLALLLRSLMQSTEPAPALTLEPATPAVTSTRPSESPPSAGTDSGTAADGDSTAPPAPPLPELEHSDAEVRASLGDILPAPLQPSLQPAELLRRASVLADGFVRGKLLRDKLPLPPVSGKTVVEQRGDQVFLAPGNYARYDAVVDTVAQFDVEALAGWFNRYEPLLQQAFDELGSGHRPVREAVISGLDLMLAAPSAGADIQLLQPAVFYKFADPALEALPESQKLLIRMGPKNRTVVLEQVRKLRDALAGAG